MSKRRRANRKKRLQGLIFVPAGHDRRASERAAHQATTSTLDGKAVMSCAFLLRDGTEIVNVVVHRGREVLEHRRLDGRDPAAVVALSRILGCVRLYLICPSRATFMEADRFWLVDPAGEAVYRSTDLREWERTTSPEHWQSFMTVDEFAIPGT